jgi:phenylalanyl-tRNA synthetase beta chain
MREFAPVPADLTAESVALRLASCGFEVAEVVATSDPVIDFEITANRPDCLSVVGLAREARVAFGLGASSVLDAPSGSSSGELTAPSAVNLAVTIEDPELCPRYAAQVARVGVAPSPAWLADRLHAAGVRPINNVVDVTNYVMLERGHPLHAFDLDKLAGRSLVVRRARKGEKLRTLDDVERRLEPDMLAIADSERAVAIAGVMGGAETEVTDRTTLIALESAWFLPRSVRATSKRLALKTEASARFERGADIEAPVSALARAMDLLEQIGAGQRVGAVVDRYERRIEPRQAGLRASRIAHLLGAAVPEADVERILTGLGFAVNPSNQDPSSPSWSITVPSWRVDVSREADLVEEVARHYGYDRLPTRFPPLLQAAPAPDPRIGRDHLARRVMMAAGFDEAVTFTFIERKAADFFVGDAELVPIANPLSEKFAVLRPSLLPGLLDALAYNRRRGQGDTRLFETGACFTRTGGERRRVAFAWVGGAADEHWSQPSRPVDFFDAKGVCEQICSAFRIRASMEPGAMPYLVRGRTGRVLTEKGGTLLGLVGQLNPAIVEAREMPGREAVYVGELDLDALGAGAHADVALEPLPRFPAVMRDLSILVADTLPAADVRGTIRSAAPATLDSVREFDRYQGKGIPEGRISLSLHLTFRAPDRTLTDAEVDEAMNGIVHALETKHGATRR